MTGDHNKVHRQSGQAFLIVIMFVSIAITVALATSFKAVTETQVTKSQEDSSKAVAAADAGAEYGVKNMSGAEPMKTYKELSIPVGPGIDTDKSRVMINVDSPTDFVSPIIKKDGQYTFYWSLLYSGGSVPTDKLYVSYGSEPGTNCDDIALEISLLQPLSTTQYQVDRYVSDTGRLFTENVKNVGRVISTTISGTAFKCRADFDNTITIPASTKLIIVRYLTKGTSETRLGFASAGGSVIPAQGKIVTAEAVTTSGIKKTVKVVQTYPQIPAEFFVTSF